MKALVLSGGGAKGAYEAGLVATLMHEFDEKFDIICGTSIGAINAAFIAQHKTRELVTLWQSIAQAAIVTPVPRVRALQQIFGDFVRAYTHKGLAKVPAWLHALRHAYLGLSDMHPLGQFVQLTGALEHEPTQRLLAAPLVFSDVQSVLITTATDLISGSPDVFYHFPAQYAHLRQGFITHEPDAHPFNPQAFAETIRASGAIPAAFSPVALTIEARNGAYVDGGVCNNTPIGQAIDAGATEITLIYLDPLPNKSPNIRVPSSLPGILISCFGLMQQRILELDYKLAMQVNDAIDAQGTTTHRRKVALRVFRPAQELITGVMDFDKQDRINDSFEQGATDARNAQLRLKWAGRETSRIATVSGTISSKPAPISESSL